jgi:HK97 family phage major capsid protein
MAQFTNTPGASGQPLKGLYPDQSFVANEVMPDALINILATNVGIVEGDEPAVRVPYIAADPTAGFTAEGSEISEQDPELDELIINTDKIAVVSRTSNEAVRNAPGSSGILSTSLTRAVTVKGNAAFLGNSATPTGLLHVAGVSDGGTLDGNLDAVENAIGQIETADGIPTHIVAHPEDWATIRGIKAATDSNVPLLGSPAEQTERRVFGLDVIVSSAATKGSLLITSKESIYAAIGQLMIDTSEDAYFTRDSVAIRATWRIGWDVIDPAHLGTVTMPAEA